MAGAASLEALQPTTLLSHQKPKAESQADLGIGAASRSGKIGKLRTVPDTAHVVEVENMPSDISDDEWGEIQKFG